MPILRRAMIDVVAATGVVIGLVAGARRAGYECEREHQADEFHAHLMENDMNRFRRGFSSPGFDQGAKSKHDRAVEAMAEVLRRGVLARQTDLASIDWTKLAGAALDEAEYQVDAQPQPKPWQIVTDSRLYRAQQLTAMIMNIVGRFMCEHGDNRGNRDASRALLEIFHAEGAELITDQMRAEAGLPRRGFKP
jgi:hypothetical protein